MKLTFLGAARMVTGSCYLLEAGGLKLLVDCGLFQGESEDLNHEPFPFTSASIDYVILTHAHIDHSGRLPLLRRLGFRGPIVTHNASRDLAEIMLMDSAHIQEQDAEWHNRKARRSGRPLVQPLYTQADVTAMLDQFQTLDYKQVFRLNEKVSVRLQDAGHILGSAIVELFVEGEGKIVFSGDIGQPNRPILQDPTIIDEADYLVVESTYGDRLHEEVVEKSTKLGEIISETLARGGNVIVPSFAVGRTQEVLYDLNSLVEKRKIPQVPVVLDSPLAIEATEITRKHREVFDRAASELVKRGDDPFQFKGLRFTRTADQSKELNQDKTSKVIIAASGMCEAGRVVHHLKHNLWRPESTVLFVGYQARGTLGRLIRDGARRVRVLGEEVAVRASIQSIQGFSAHGDQTGLVNWIESFSKRPRRIFLTHGEPDAQDTLIGILKAKGFQVEAPNLGDSVNLQPVTSGKQPKRTGRVGGVASGALVAQGAQEIELIGKEYRRLAKLWRARKSVPAGDAKELVARAAEVRVALEGLRRLVESNEGPAVASSMEPTVE